MKVAVFGAGTMGSGIAQVFAAKGHTALMYASSVASAQKHKDKLAASLQKRVEKGKMTQEAVDALLANILVEEKSACAGADLIIECVKEDMATKKELLNELDGLCKPEAIFASNTSSISMTSLAAATSRPEKVVGMHFFSPVPVMSLVEIVYGLRTSKETIDIVDELGKSMGKRTILAKDKPGFIVNRMLLPMLNEAVQVLDEDIGTVEDVDEGMMRGCNHPMGPLALADMIGLDILLEVMETFYLDLGDTKYRPAHLLRKMVSAGYLGRKSGAGFYVYDEGKKIGVNPVLVKA